MIKMQFLGVSSKHKKGRGKKPTKAKKERKEKISEQQKLFFPSLPSLCIFQDLGKIWESSLPEDMHSKSQSQ